MNGQTTSVDATLRTEEAILEDLRALAERERLQVDQLEALLTGKRTHLEGLERALAALRGENTERKPHHPHKHSRSANNNDWQISDEKTAQVWGLVRQRTENFTATALSDETPGLSAESTRRALVILREREYVRVVGKARGGGVLLGVMPDATEREYPDATA